MRLFQRRHGGSAVGHIHIRLDIQQQHRFFRRGDLCGNTVLGGTGIHAHHIGTHTVGGLRQDAQCGTAAVCQCFRGSMNGGGIGVVLCFRTQHNGGLFCALQQGGGFIAAKPLRPRARMQHGLCGQRHM